MAADAPRNVARPIRPLHWNTLVLEERARAGRPSGVLPPRQLTRELHTATAIYWNEVLGATRCRGRQPERTEPELWVTKQRPFGQQSSQRAENCSHNLYR
jgi:hypothetical protein